ncbi:MAG: DNA repair protein RecN [Bacillota bacterium]|nr:DNA repair protein RecN [Bacillota bacterium]MDW7683165.1 DNA repair protein RecN [Bacillota bacterium]
MLRMLEVENLALIDNLVFYPGEGLNVITGETGAGKSMLLGAVSLLLGERANPEAIRAGEESAMMQAVFSVPEGFFPAADTDNAEELVICREIRKNGPNICRINNRVQPLAGMSALGKRLVDLHGQNRQQSLLDPATQCRLLDSFGGEEHAKLLAKLAEGFGRLGELQRVLDDLGGDEAALARHADFLRFQLDEIAAARLCGEEEAELEKRFNRLTHAHQLADRTAKIYAELYEGAYDGAIVDRLGTVEKELAAAAALDEDLSELLDRIVSVSEQLTDAARELRTYHDEINLDEAELQSVVQRLEHYKTIKKKYGPTVDDVHALAEKLQRELDELAGRNDALANAEQEAAGIRAQMDKTAAELSRLRKEAAAVLAAEINDVLQNLALQGAVFAVTVEEASRNSKHGCDSVEFVFTANAGEPPRPLAKTASGGEVSRVMLAIKSVLAMQDSVPTLIFDEIDAGIGGITVRRVAEKLVSLSRHRQVICVTHQPLIAAAANQHFAIYKENRDGRTVTRLVKLNDKDREKELARMLGGEEGVALEHAQQMLKNNK